MATSPHPLYKIALNDKERLIFDLLLQVVRHFNLKTQLRVAGGWVRDKLLGMDSDDIDIALDDMLGREFCEKITEYFYSVGDGTAVAAAVVPAKPEKSKLETAAKSAQVKAAIADKISHERIGHEVDLMISGKDPVKAMTYICNLSLFSAVFTVPQLASSEGLDRLCLINMDAAANLLKLLDCSAFNNGERRLTFYAALLLPLRKFTYKDEKSKEIPLVDYIFQDSLKRKKDDAKAVKVIHNAAERFASLIPYFISNKDMDMLESDLEKETVDIPLASKLRLHAGLLLDECKGMWQISLLISTLLYPDVLDLTEYASEDFDLNKKKETFTTVESSVIKLGLEEVALGNLKPLVDGNGIMSALKLKSPSPVVGEWRRKVRQWQLAHPLATRDEYVDWIKETHSKKIQLETVLGFGRLLRNLCKH